MAQKLFGTDGVRGRAGDYPLDRATVARLGAAVVRALPRANGSRRILIGRDTRESMSSTLRQFGDYAEAGDWLVLNEAETAILERGDGFAELARFDMPPEMARAAAR